MPLTTETILPTEQESRLARESGESLAALEHKEGSVHLHIHTADNQERELPLPLPLLRLLQGALLEFGKGNGVTLTPVQKEFTTQQAADFLMVSRPFLIEELLEKGKIPFRKVGNRRRIRYADLLRYRQEEEQEIARREQVMLELMAETERLGLYK
jgi:excisionase family DNA binding protein